MMTTGGRARIALVLFFFQAEDGIRDLIVTGVQTCALPISSRRRHTRSDRDWRSEEHTSELQSRSDLVCRLLLGSEEHTSELQSRSDLVCRLLLEKKKKNADVNEEISQDENYIATDDPCEHT